MSLPRLTVAIDPGLSGGIAWTWSNEPEPLGVYARKMPDTPKDILDLLNTLEERSCGCECIMENVGGSRPGNAAKGSRTFAVHQGHLEMALLAAGIPVKKVTPAKWMNYLVPDRTKGEANYTKRKNQIKAAVQARFPHLKVTLATADALGILLYAMDAER